MGLVPGLAARLPAVPRPWWTLGALTGGIRRRRPIGVRRVPPQQFLQLRNPRLELRDASVLLLQAPQQRLTTRAVGIRRGFVHPTQPSEASGDQRTEDCPTSLDYPMRVPKLRLAPSQPSALLPTRERLRSQHIKGRSAPHPNRGRSTDIGPIAESSATATEGSLRACVLTRLLPASCAPSKVWRPSLANRLGHAYS